MMSYMIVIQVTNHDGNVTPVIWWSQSQSHKSCNIKKNIEDSRIDNIIWHSNNMLAL